MFQNLRLLIAIVSLTTTPAIAAMSEVGSAPHAGTSGISNRPQVSNLHDGSGFAIRSGSSGFATSIRGNHFLVANGLPADRHDRVPDGRSHRVNRPSPFRGGLPYYGFYGGGVYSYDDYDGGSGNTTNVIVDTGGRGEGAEPPIAPKQAPAALAPHMVTLSRQPSQAADRNSVTEIRGTSVSTVRFP